MNEPNYWIPPRGFTIPIGDGFTIYYNAIMIVCGIILATVVVGLLFKRRNIPVEWVLDLLLCVLPVGIVCARLFYCITGGVPFPYWFSLDEEHGIRAGGLSIIGGVMGGVLGVVLFCVITRSTSCASPTASRRASSSRRASAAGATSSTRKCTAAGRKHLACNGSPSPSTSRIRTAGTTPSSFTRACSTSSRSRCCLRCCEVPQKAGGLALAGYLFGYGVVRAIMEPLRAPQYILGDSVQVSWVMAIVMAVAGVMLALCLLIWNYKKYGRLFGAPDEAEAYADLPVYYTKEARLAMEEAERKKRAARKAKAGGHPKPEQGAARAGGHPARGAGRSLEETLEPSAPEQDPAEEGKPSARNKDAAQAGEPSAPEQDAAEEGKPSAPEQGAAEAGKPSAPEQDPAEAGKPSAPEQAPRRRRGRRTNGGGEIDGPQSDAP